MNDFLFAMKVMALKCKDCAGASDCTFSVKFNGEECIKKKVIVNEQFAQEIAKKRDKILLKRRK